VTELTQSKVAFLVSSGPAIRAVKEARDIPVLFVISGDPSSWASWPVSGGRAGTSRV
jgi:hypothetical protein